MSFVAAADAGAALAAGAWVAPAAVIPTACVGAADPPPLGADGAPEHAARKNAAELIEPASSVRRDNVFMYFALLLDSSWPAPGGSAHILLTRLRPCQQSRKHRTIDDGGLSQSAGRVIIAG